MKSCYNCKNQNIYKHKHDIFNRLEIVLFIIKDPSGFVNMIAEGIGERCKYYSKETPEQKELKDEM